MLTGGIVANGIAHSSMLATNLLVPFMLERGRGLSPSYTAELITVMSLSMLVATYLAGLLYSRRPTPSIGIGAMALLACGLFALGRLGSDLPFLGLFPIVIALGAGLGAFTAVNNTAVMSSVSAEQRGFAAGLVEMTRQLGHSLGTTISSTILAASLAAASLPTAAIERITLPSAAIGYRNGFTDAASVMAFAAFAGVTVVLVAARRSRPVRTAPLAA